LCSMAFYVSCTSASARTISHLASAECLTDEPMEGRFTTLVPVLPLGQPCPGAGLVYRMEPVVRGVGKAVG
jgi:hypothetical protein